MVDPKAYRIDLQYDGANFEGWQSQPQGTGVQDHLEKALQTFLRHPVRVIGASRTDSGVHAEHQVAIFRTEQKLDERRWLKSLRGLLPETIGIRSIVETASDFHPIYHARGKAYRYRLWLGVTRNPMVAPYCWSIPYTLDSGLMAQASQDFIGTHDFTSFSAVDSTAKTKVRTIYEIKIFQKGPLVDIWVVGEGFLKQMIRTMVGTLVDIGRGAIPPTEIPKILDLKDRTCAGITAPAQGLSLVEIFYDDIAKIDTLRSQLATEFCLKI